VSPRLLSLPPRWKPATITTWIIQSLSFLRFVVFSTPFVRRFPTDAMARRLRLSRADTKRYKQLMERAMNGLAIMMTMAVLGVDYGWQPSTDGQLEYIIQIEPALLESMKQGEKIVSEIHPDARGARRFVIQVGTGDLPRKNLISPATSPTRLGVQDAQPGGSAASLGDGPTLHTNNPPATAFNGLASPPPGDRTAQPAEYQPLPGDGLVTNFLRNLPPPPPGSVDNAPIPAAGANPAAAPLAGGQGQGPTLAAPSTNTQPTAPQFPNGTGGNAGDFQLPPWVGAGDSPATPNSNVPATDNVGGGGFPLQNGFPTESGAGQSPPNPRPIQPPTLYDRNQSPITDPDAAKAGRKKSETAPEEDSPSDRVGRLAANLPRRSDAASQKPTLDEKTARELAEAGAPKPWMPLVLTSFALFASLAANMYLGWIAIGIYRRYRSVVGQLHQARTAPA
jgi:hypothetical protein